ncbi:hypothetical protein [Azospirillum soli]|uniref:hypothetical protein n=1 Tax=Azospirillum soli TaxID=1304799 RepID=UPI001AE5EAEC|nr:hypothetical protein [Azospirillum soli]MBP2315512.1 hypothetical protein [Azospirillum soli]
MTNHADACLDAVLATINAPRPVWLTGDGLLECLRADSPDPQWRPHVEALFDECSEEALHDLVLAGVVDFATLERALAVWDLGDARAAPWVREMAWLTREYDRLNSVGDIT